MPDTTDLIAELLAAKYEKRVRELLDFPRLVQKAAISAIRVDLRDDIREALASQRPA